MSKSMSIFRKRRRLKEQSGKIIMMNALLFLCVYQVYTLGMLYENIKTAHEKEMNTVLMDGVERLNLNQASAIPSASFTYHPDRGTVRILKEAEQVDTTIAVAVNSDLHLINCRACYDIRDTSVWRLDTLSVLVTGLLEQRKLEPVYRLALTDESGKVCDSILVGTSKIGLWTNEVQVALGFLEPHLLTGAFVYSFNSFLYVNWAHLLATFCLLVLLIFLVYSLYLQFEREKKAREYESRAIYSLVHGMRTPAVYIKLALQMMTSSDTERREELNKECIQKLEEMWKPMDKLLLIPIDEQRFVLDKTCFEMSTMIRLIASIYDGKYADKKVNIWTSSDIALLVRIDPYFLAMAINNLIENSICYSGPKVNIRINFETRRRTLRLTVTDNGFGIPKKEQAYIFEKSYRGERYRKDKNYPGAGLGLYMTRSIIEEYHGKISVKSNGIKGSKFTIVFRKKYIYDE